MKNVGERFVSGLDKIRQLKVFNYTFKDDKEKTPRVGVIAQDLQKIFPNAVTKGEDGFLRIRMEDMFYAVINAIKELDANITKLIQTVERIEKDNFQLKKDNAQILKENKELKFYNKKLEARLDALEKKLK